ncbi:hypothetical protein CcaverHIS002_0103430 [Cutaneotrichosporon cavernicola]|nr:hypothetical protein CcaverHIS002_0103430 [Cutaneotrichosporon cavernicola]
MSFQPSHQQPFTPAEAAQLDVEISRLRNSLTHLHSTQGELRLALVEEDDADLRSALNENEAVIASQSRRGQSCTLRHRNPAPDERERGERRTHRKRGRGNAPVEGSWNISGET